MSENSNLKKSKELGNIITNIISSYKLPFLTSMCIGLLAYGFVISNKLINHDELYGLFGKGATLVSGRWGLDLVSYILPDYSMPWLWGILTLIFISIAVCVTINIFNIESKVMQCMLAGVIICFPSLTGTFCYMFTSSAFGLAMLLSVLAVYFFKKETKVGMVIALVFMVLSLGIYQAYIAITASFLVILLIQSLLKNETDAKAVIIKGIKYVVFLGISLVVYYIITQLLLHMNSMVLGEYASDKTDLKHGLFVRVAYAYYQFVRYFLFGTLGLINIGISKVVHLVCLVVIFAMIVVMRRNVKPVSQNILLLVLIALLPLSINCMYIFVNAGAVHTLVVYGFIAVYVFAAVVVETVPDTIRTTIAKYIVIGALLIVIASNVFMANKIYLRMHMEYENMYSYYNSIMTQVKMTPGFDENSTVALLGTALESSYMSEFGSEIIKGFPDDMKDKNKELFIHYYLGIDVPFASEDEKKMLEKNIAVKEMNVYPYYGSVQKVDNYIVVKLSE